VGGAIVVDVVVDSLFGSMASLPINLVNEREKMTNDDVCQQPKKRKRRESPGEFFRARATFHNVIYF
jgi:hypothetical protein